MPITTLSDLVTLAKNRIDELDVDSQIDTILQEGINFAYVFKTGKLEKQFKIATLSPVSGIITLPDDFVKIEKIYPALSNSEYRKGLTIFVDTVDDTVYTITYESSRTSLSLTDTVVASNKLKYLLVTYGCFAYQQYKKRPQVANMYLSEFKDGMAELEYNNESDLLAETGDEVTDVIFANVIDDDTVVGEW